MSAWEEIIVQGPERALRAFIAGFRAGRGGGSDAFLGADFDLEPSSFSTRIRELFAAGSHHLVFCPEVLAEDLVEALQHDGSAVGLVPEERRRVLGARLSFRIELFSEELAPQVKNTLLGELPEGVTLEDFHEEEERHGGARESELYTPVHGFVYRASGGLVGPLLGVLEIWRRGRQIDFVEVSPIDLTTAAH